jgi:hypothetical protein
MSRINSYPDGYILQPGDRIVVSRQGRTLSVTGAGITSGATPAEQFDDYKRYNDARVQALTEQNSRLIALVEAATGTPLPSLNALYLSTTAFTAGTMFNATIAGATPGSTITATADDGTTLNVTGGLLSGTFTTAGSKTITLTEALAGYFNSPNQNQIVVAVADAGTGTPTPTPTPSAFTMTQLASPNRIYQRSTLTGGSQNKGSGTIPVSIDVTTPGPVYARVRGTDGTILQASTLITTTTTTGAQTVNVPVDARLGWFYPDMSGDGATWQNGTVLVGMGRLIAMSGQSQAVRQFAKMPAYAGTNASLGVTIDPNSAVYARYTDTARTLTTPAWALPVDGGAYDSTFVSEMLRRQIADKGVNCGAIGHAVGSTAIAAWQPGQINNADLRAVLDAAGGFEAFYWHQGGDDAGAGTSAAAYQAGLTGVFGDLASRNAARGSSYERYVTAMATRLAGGAGSTAAVQTIRKAASDWSAANNAVYLEPHDINLEDAVHQGQPGSIVLARHLHRAMSAATDTGPTITGASRVTTAITLTTSGALALVGAPTNRFTVYAAGTITTPLTVSSVAVSGSSITLNLAADPGDAQALDVYWLRHPDPSGTTAAANMIYDTYTADGLSVGRQLQPTLAAPVAVAASVGGTPSLNALTVSPSSATIGTPYSGTISGLTSGSSIALTGAGAAGLSIAGAVITGTPTTAGAVNIVETLAGATGSPRTSSGVVTVSAAGAVTFSDTFTGADGTNLTAHTSDTGQSWTAILGTSVIGNNRSYYTTAGAYYSSYVPASANYTVKGQLTFVSLITSTAAWILGRASGTGSTRTHYQAGFQDAGTSGRGWYIGKTVNNTFSVIADAYAPVTPVAGSVYNIELVMAGDQLSLIVDGVTVITAKTDTSITAAGAIGTRGSGPVASLTTGIHIDNLTV